MSSVRSRAWVYTVNGAGVQANLVVSELSRCGCSYTVAQNELAPTTQQPHVQGFLYCSDAKTLTAVQKMFGTFKPHLEIARGSVEQNLAYCTKDSTRVPGTVPKWFCAAPEFFYFVTLYDFSFDFARRAIGDKIGPRMRISPRPCVDDEYEGDWPAFGI